MESIGITGTVLEICRFYSMNRWHMIKIGDYQFSPQPITYGVPQGSIPGPVSFLIIIYVNNIREADLNGHLSLRRRHLFILF